MADILLDEQSKPTNPASGQMVLYPDSGSSVFTQVNDAGLVQGDSMIASIAQQASFSADTYITRSGLQLPSSSMQAGMVFEWRLLMTKGAGVAAPVFTIRVGAAQSVADTGRLVITLGAQTAVADTGIIKVLATVRSVGAAGVLQGSVWLQHNLAATGFATTPAGLSIVQGTSAGFDNSALGGQYVGLSINPGAAGAWVCEQAVGLILYG